MAFRDAMLTDAEFTLVSRMSAADLRNFGLRARYDMPVVSGSGLYLADGGYSTRFGAPVHW